MLKKKQIIKAFNAWMDDYIKDPESFKHQTSSVLRHMEEKFVNSRPTYGDNCEALLKFYAEKE